MLAHLESIHLRQHNIQQNHVVCILCRHLKRLLTVVGAIHFHAVLLQTETDSLYD